MQWDYKLLSELTIILLSLHPFSSSRFNLQSNQYCIEQYNKNDVIYVNDNGGIFGALLFSLAMCGIISCKRNQYKIAIFLPARKNCILSSFTPRFVNEEMAFLMLILSTNII